MSLIRRQHRVIADFDLAFGMRINAVAEMASEQLRAEADAKKRLLLFQRHVDPVDLAPEPIVLVIGAHRTAEDNGTGIIAQRFGRASPKRGRLNIELEPLRLQPPAEPARRGILLMEDDGDFSVL